MKKGINILIGGKLYSIEEEAYEMLNVYLNSLNKYFAEYEDKDSIVTDIESRLGELFNTFITEKNPILTKESVDVVIKKMGTVSDFEEVESSVEKKRVGDKKEKGDMDRNLDGGSSEASLDEATASAEPGSQFQFRKRLLRNVDDMKIAGVCSGLAAFYGVDVTYLRMSLIFFAFLGLFTWGTITFVIIIGYLTLWYVVPEASTISDKLQIEGTPLNINEIKRVAEIESSNSDSINSNKSVGHNNDKTLFNKFGEGMRHYMPTIMSTFVKLSKLVIGLSGLGILISSFLALIGICAGYIIALINYDSYYVEIPFYHFMNVDGVQGAIISSLVIVTLPMALLMMLGWSLFLLKNRFVPFLTFGIVIVWIISLISGFSFTALATPGLREVFYENRGEFEKVGNSIELEPFDQIVINMPKNRYSNSDTTLNDVEYEGDMLWVRVENREGFVAHRYGLEEAINNYTYKVENGILYIEGLGNLEIGEDCFICQESDSSVQIFTPQLKKITILGDSISYVHIEGFDRGEVQIEGDGGINLNDAVTFIEPESEIEEDLL